jgi:uncharacterized membrane protein (DUF441 family)
VPSSNNRALAIGLVVLAAAFAALAVFYFTTDTSLLASGVGRHTKHALLATGLAVLSLIAANIARRPSA